MIDKHIMQECLSMLMVGGKEHANLFQDVRAWAIRNEARIWTFMNNDPKNAPQMQDEFQRWNHLLDILANVATENQNSVD